MGFFERLLGGHHTKRRYHDNDFHDSDYRHGRRIGSVQPVGGVVCQGCRSVNQPGARFCHQCGKNMASTSCAQCAAILPTGAKFCGQCGRATRD